MYHAACKVEFRPFHRSYSQLTFFNFIKYICLYPHALSSHLWASSVPFRIYTSYPGSHYCRHASPSPYNGARLRLFYGEKSTAFSFHVNSCTV